MKAVKRGQCLPMDTIGRAVRVDLKQHPCIAWIIDSPNQCGRCLPAAKRALDNGGKVDLIAFRGVEKRGIATIEITDIVEDRCGQLRIAQRRRIKNELVRATVAKKRVMAAKAVQRVIEIAAD